jgi:hypothetical protein
MKVINIGLSHEVQRLGKGPNFGFQNIGIKIFWWMRFRVALGCPPRLWAPRQGKDEVQGLS